MHYLYLRLILLFKSFHSTKVLLADVVIDSPTTPIATVMIKQQLFINKWYMSVG